MYFPYEKEGVNSSQKKYMARAELCEKDTKGLMRILTCLSKGTPFVGGGSRFSGGVPDNLFHRRANELLAPYKA